MFSNFFRRKPAPPPRKIKDPKHLTSEERALALAQIRDLKITFNPWWPPIKSRSETKIEI